VSLALQEVNLYEFLGGEEPFRSLVADFYRGVEADPLLRPMYPEDLEPARERLALFLIQYWGGPRTYDVLRGHPRLRMRHFPFPIGTAERDAWLRHMRAALDAAALPDPAPELMWAHFHHVAHFLVNREE
jgi:hemoglobin